MFNILGMTMFNRYEWRQIID